MSTAASAILAVTAGVMYLAAMFLGADLLEVMGIFLIGVVLYGLYHFKHER